MGLIPLIRSDMNLHEHTLCFLNRETMKKNVQLFKDVNHVIRSTTQPAERSSTTEKYSTDERGQRQNGRPVCMRAFSHVGHHCGSGGKRNVESSGSERLHCCRQRYRKRSSILPFNVSLAIGSYAPLLVTAVTVK